MKETRQNTKDKRQKTLGVGLRVGFAITFALFFAFWLGLGASVSVRIS
jgi:pilus assembly protein TadC